MKSTKACLSCPWSWAQKSLNAGRPSVTVTTPKRYSRPPGYSAIAFHVEEQVAPVRRRQPRQALSCVDVEPFPRVLSRLRLPVLQCGLGAKPRETLPARVGQSDLLASRWARSVSVLMPAFLSAAIWVLRILATRDRWSSSSQRRAQRSRQWQYVQWAQGSGFVSAGGPAIQASKRRRAKGIVEEEIIHPETLFRPVTQQQVRELGPQFLQPFQQVGVNAELNEVTGRRFLCELGIQDLVAVVSERGRPGTTGSGNRHRRARAPGGARPGR